MEHFSKAVRDLLAAQRICPRCHAQNIPHAKPTIEEEQDGSLSCTTCGHNWTVKR